MSNSTGTATLVNIDEELSNNLVFFISKSLPAEVSDEDRQAFTDSCNALIEGKKGLELAAKVLEKGHIILALEETSAIEGFFQAIIAVILSFGEDSGAIKQMIDVLISDKGGEDEAKSALRLKIMLGLFNFISVPANKYTTIMAIFNFALETKQENSVANFHSYVGSWVQNWGATVSVEQQRALYLVVRQVLQRRGAQAAAASSESVDPSQQFFISYLSTFPATKLDSEPYNLAVDAVKKSINGPIASFEERAALLESLSADQISGNGPLNELVKLLSILCQGSLEDFQGFEKAGVALMKEHGIDSDAITRTMKLLSLCKLANGKEVLQYSEVAQTLKLDEDFEVEMWIVDAIAEGILEANMDQFNKTITVTRCSYRSFGKEQWQDVKSKLAALRVNVVSVLDEMRKYNA